MKKILTILVLVFFVDHVSAESIQDYKAYTHKIFDSVKEAKIPFASLKANSEIEKWITSVDSQLDTDNLVNYNVDLVFSLDQLGQIDAIELRELKEFDFEKFKTFISALSSLRFPQLSKGLSNFNYELEGKTLYLHRPTLEAIQAKIRKDNQLEEKLKNIDSNFSLVKPNFLEYSFIGQEIIIKNNQDLYFKTYVTDQKNKEIYLKAFLVYDKTHTQKINFDFILEKDKNQGFVTKLIESGIGGALKAGLVNSYTSYGIMPGALAVLSMTGTTLLENETEDSFSIEHGEKIEIKTLKEERK